METLRNALMKAGSRFFRRIFQAVLLLLCLASGAAVASGNTTKETDFGECLEQLRSLALDRGVDPGVVETALGDVSPLDSVVRADTTQPEFTTTFGDYLEHRVNRGRVEYGRELLQRHRSLLRRIEQRYGVGGEYVLALWALETSFGRNQGDIRLVDALATLACHRRREYFGDELISALRILEDSDVDADELRGSWAGAMGHVQFMPSVFRRHAVDFDGDGFADIRSSLPDAFASAASFLAALGWNRGERWGREVRLPEDFPLHLGGLDSRRPLSEWRELDVRTVFGNPVPTADMKASLLLPSGHEGPAFLVYENFHRLLDWNRSAHFALTVGYLADRIAGLGQLRQWPDEDVGRLTPAQLREIQRRLEALGHSPGEVDGVTGTRTRAAIRGFQKSIDVPADGFPDEQLLRQLRRHTGSEAGPDGPSR